MNELLKPYINEFIEFSRRTKGISDNTEVSIKRDLKKFEDFLVEEDVSDPLKVNKTLINSYVLNLEKNNYATSTMSRYISTLKSFWTYMYAENIVQDNPMQGVKPPRIIKKGVDSLSIEQVDKLLTAPDEKTAKGLRDRAMLELLYATGIKVSEIISLMPEDINLSMNYIICHDGKKERLVPFGSKAREAMVAYLQLGRNQLILEDDSNYIFVNINGSQLSRQGFWKIIKHYGKKAEIDKEITPQLLRDSFAIHMLKNGADFQSLQEMLGHSDINVTTRAYGGVMHKKLREVYAKSHPRI